MNDTQKKLLVLQKNEITEHFIYQRLARDSKKEGLKKLLNKIADQEKKHYELLKSKTGKKVDANKTKIFFYVFVAKIFGLNFGLQLMEKGESSAKKNYAKLSKDDKEFESVWEDEDRHEQELLSTIDEGALKYAGSIVLGLNDALVELTGALAGFTLSLQNTRLISMVGLITGIAASMSMAGSEYLSLKHDGEKNSLRGGLLTGLAYVFAVIVLIFPYFIFKTSVIALGFSLVLAVLIILFFNFYISVAKKLAFKSGFFEMVCISLGVATVNFFIGYLIKIYFNI